jgi:hypothetical protein
VVTGRSPCMNCQSGIPSASDIDLDAQLSIAIAQEQLSECHGLDLDRALGVLRERAHRAGIPLVEAARWLLSTDTLP